MRRSDLLSVVSVLDLESVWDRAATAALERTRARHVVLMVHDHDHPRLLTRGLDTVEAEALLARAERHAASPPDEEDPGVARLRDPDTGGEVLRVPIAADGGLVGELVLAHPDRGGFAAADVAGLSVLSQVTGVAVRNARTYALSEQRREWGELTALVNESVRPPYLLIDPLDRINAGALRLARAELAAIVHLTDDVENVATVAGSRAALLPELLEECGQALRATQRAGKLLEAPYAARGTLVGIPLDPTLSFQGTLLLLLDRGSGRLTAEDRELLTSFVTHGSLVLDRTVLQRERQQQVVAADRDRIARDLHDVVIQRIFASGLKLQQIRRQAGGEAHGPLEEVVRDLDSTIRDIRTTIFDLERPHTLSLRSEVQALAAEYEPALGFAPVVRIWGPVSSLVDDAVAEQATAVLREALSNCARHAQARTCEVEVAAEDGWVSLVVTDDGRGPGGDDGHHSGLRNLRRRAEALGGVLSVEGRPSGGTRLCWRVPLAGQVPGSASAADSAGASTATEGDRGHTSSAATDSSTQHTPVTSR